MIELPDPDYDEYDEILTIATLTAIRTWLAAITLRVFPPPPSKGATSDPHPHRVLDSTEDWVTAVITHLVPVSQLVTAHRLTTVADTRNLPQGDGSQPSTLVEPLTTLGDKHGLPINPHVLATPTWRDLIERLSRTTPNKVAGMPEDTYREIITHLSRMMRDGETVYERSRWVRDFLNLETEGGYEGWLRRATRIARTETTRLVNAADLEAMKTEAATTEQELHKVWVSTMDPRTRDTHFRADGQRVPIDQPFLIGGFEADHPGDPNLPAHESVNCRCTVTYITPDEPLPAETDRQTERERSDGTRRNPGREVAARAARDVTRDRDNPTEATLTAGGTMRHTWTGLIARTDTPTGDGRTILGDGITFRDFPLPLMWQKATGAGHSTAVIIGKMTAGAVTADGVEAAGELFDTPEAAEAVDLINEGVIRPSVDLSDIMMELDEPADDDDQPSKIIVTACKVMGVTLVAKPAFEGTWIRVTEPQDTPSGDEDSDSDGEEEALTAAVGLLDPPTVDPGLFSDPGLAGPTALTLDSETGRVYGHLALWGTEHVGMPGRGITPPHSHTGYALFHVSTLDTTDGPISVGRLTVGCGHAAHDASMTDATAHYDNAGTTWAYVRAGEDTHGIWVSGIINPDAPKDRIRAGLTAPLSGDWRNVGGNLELVAALSVNTPGFPVPRAYSTTQARAYSLVACGVLRPQPATLTESMIRRIMREELSQHDTYQLQRGRLTALAARHLNQRLRAATR